MYAIWLGAGYSYSVAGLPLAAQLFDFRIETWPRESKRLDRVKSLKEEWDRVAPDALAEQFVAAMLQRGGQSSEDILWYISRRLTDPFVRQAWGRRMTMAIDDFPGCPGAAFLNTLAGAGCSGIITTNYDLLVEYSLGSKRFHYGIPGERLSGTPQWRPGAWLHPVVLKGATPLAKIHGSVSWEENTRYVDARRGISGKASILAPVPGKKRADALAPAWDLAGIILARSERIVVYGFAFNSYDTDVLELMQSAGKNVQHVLLVDPYPNTTAAQEVWPNAHIDTAPPLPDGGTAVCDWLGLAD